MKRSIEFKSTPDNFKKEKSGLKNNTTRIYDSCEGYDFRFSELYSQFNFKEYGKIKIVNSMNKKEHFCREIKDISCCFNYPKTPTRRYTTYVITWKRKRNSQNQK